MPRFTLAALAAAASTFVPLELVPLAGGKKQATAPSEIRISAWGVNETTKGPYVLDEEGAASILAAFEAYGNDLALDFEHQTLAENVTGPVPASGWIKQGDLFTRGKPGDESGGLFARVTWTDEARAMIEAKQYRYFSPTFVLEKLEDGTRRAVELMPVALVNYPATIGMEPLIAAKAGKAGACVDRRSLDRLSVDGAPSFDEIRNALDRALAMLEAKIGGWAWTVEVFDGALIFSVGGRLFRASYRMEANGTAVIEGEAVEVTRVYQPNEGDTAMKLTLKALKLAESTTDAELALHVGKQADMIAEVLTLTGAPNLDEARGALAALARNAKRATELEAEILELKSSALAAEEKAILDTAIVELKITPAEGEELAARPGAKTDAGVKWLKGFVAKLSAKAPNEKTGEGKAKAAKTEGASSKPATSESDAIALAVSKLTPRQKRMAKAAGVTLEAFAASTLRRARPAVEDDETDETDGGDDTAGKE